MEYAEDLQMDSQESAKRMEEDVFTFRPTLKL